MWLMVFNCCYALMDVDKEGMIGGKGLEQPTFRKVLMIRLLVSLLQDFAGLLISLSFL